MSRAEAANSNSYVGRIMTNPNATFVLQVHQIARGKLKAENNVLGVHTRNADGEFYDGDLAGGPLDNETISVARIFLLYPSGQ